LCGRITGALLPDNAILNLAKEKTEIIQSRVNKRSNKTILAPLFFKKLKNNIIEIFH